MTGFLASVKSMAEARLALSCQVDILDLKDPRNGALGALAPAELQRITACAAGRTCVSATIGDMGGDIGFDAGLIRRRIRETAAAGVDIVKIGVFAPAALARLLGVVRPLSTEGIRMVLVCFADRGVDLDGVDAAADAGMLGVMLDTADKRSGNLRCHASDALLADFVGRTGKAGLLSGLAGALRQSDIADLLALRPDYLGFRGALCGGERNAALDLRAVQAIRSQIPRNEATLLSRSSSGLATGPGE